MNYIVIKNNQTVSLASIPVLEYENFLEQNTSLLNDLSNHCVNYFGFPYKEKIKLLCCIANDQDGSIFVSSSLLPSPSPIQNEWENGGMGESESGARYPSFTQHHFAFEKFEREIHENFGINYIDHPWLKPVRYHSPSPTLPNGKGVADTLAADCAKESPSHRGGFRRGSPYPFFKIESDELHEVGVGPIHAGVIEPGHFRFICNGEQILHLEIQLGFQHRGIEKLFLEKKNALQRITLAENIAGDTVAGHTTAFVNLWESLCGYQADDDLQFARTLALELERIAVHTGGLSAMCTDVAYQLGSSVFGRLRTPVINYFQIWCGNRFAKGLIRTGKNHFPFTKELGDTLKNLFDEYEPDFDEMCNVTFGLPTVLARFEKTGIVTNEQATAIGTVGMTARASGLERDVRKTHSHDLYSSFAHQPVVKRHGDVYSRAQIRKVEIKQSIEYIRKLLENIPEETVSRKELSAPAVDSFTISLVEGWRGEICHCAITDERGELLHYKIKDPSFHNWLALALSVRNNEISDFPICNKSFDLSYCGHDL